MIKPLIELITCDSGDWQVLRVNKGEDFSCEGHSIPDFEWINLLKSLGFEVKEKCISDRNMERGKY